MSNFFFGSAVTAPTLRSGHRQWTGNTFQNLYTTTLAALGSPDHIGFFEDAFPTEGETFDGIMHVNKFNATQNYTPSAPIPGGDMTNGFITVPNFPASDAAPKPAAGTVPSLPGGLSLSSGATYKAYYNFTPSGNVTSRGKLNSDVYYQSIYGNENTILGSDGIEGDTASNWSEPRLYPTGSSYNLLNFTSAGLNLGVACSLNNTSAGCTQGNIYGTLVAFRLRYSWVTLCIYRCRPVMTRSGIRPLSCMPVLNRHPGRADIPT